MTDVNLRTATADDVPRIVALVNAAYRPKSGQEGWTHESEIFDGGVRIEAWMLLEILEDASISIIVAQSGGGGIIGCVQVEMTGDIGFLGLLAVDSQSQAGGLGRRLVRYGESHAGARGAREIRLQTLHARPALIAWYQRQGYALTGEAIAFPYIDPRHGAARVPNLQLLMLAKSLHEID
jgi:ribosomal protein S18 acetylase RimI-like enzyme